jgi:hypothetical protein
MAPSIQILHVHYQGKKLSILDSDDTTPIYSVDIPAKGMKMFLSHGVSFDSSSPPPYELATRETSKPFASAKFGALSTLVSLTVHSRHIALQREKTFNRNYIFASAKGEALRWENDGMLSGDWKLVGAADAVKARFRNKVFSSSELGTFELMGVAEDEERDLVVMSGLAVLAMVQSTLLAALVLTGGED